MALAKLSESLAKQPQDVSLWFTQGTVLAQLDRYAQAEQSYRRGLALDPENERMILNLANVLARGGRQHEALAMYLRLAGNEGAEANVWVSLVTFLVRQGRRQSLSEALRQVSRGLENYPQDGALWCMKGYILDRLGHPLEAIASFEKGHALSEQRSVWWLAHGNALLHAEMPSDAMVAFQRSIDAAVVGGDTEIERRAWAGRYSGALRLRRWRDAWRALHVVEGMLFRELLSVLRS